MTLSVHWLCANDDSSLNCLSTVGIVQKGDTDLSPVVLFSHFGIRREQEEEGRMEWHRNEGPEAQCTTKSRTQLIMEQMHQSLSLHRCLSPIIHPQALLHFGWKSFQRALRKKWLRREKKMQRQKWSTRSLTPAMMPWNLAREGRPIGRLSWERERVTKKGEKKKKKRGPWEVDN